MITPKPYQELALQAEAKHRADHPDETRLAIVMATGLGKGMIIAFRAVRHAHEARGRVLIVAHTEEIVADLANRCRLIAGQSGGRLTVGVVKAERDEPTADIVVASVQTLTNPERRARIWDVGLVIVDECHHATAPSYQAALEYYGCTPGALNTMPWTPFHAVPALGFTATLERADGQGLGTVWQNVCFTRDISWGVRHGYLVQPIGHRLEIDTLDLTLGGSNAFLSGQAIDHALVDAMAPEKIVEKWLELAKGRPTVAFMPLVRSAHALEAAFDFVGISAAVVHGAMPDSDRRLILKRYEAGDIQVICNAMVLTEGWDSPRTKCVIVGRPTKSRSLFVQMAGRGLRPIPGKPVEDQDCILIAVSDATSDLCSVADLSDRPLDRKLQGALIAMEDQWDIGRDLLEAEQEKLWTGQVSVKEFDPLVKRSSKVWRATEHGTPYLPISKDGEYVFIVGTSVFVYADAYPRVGYKVLRLHKDLPDLELAMTVAEDEAQDRGGDLGALLADRNRAWRRPPPSAAMVAEAERCGLGNEVARIMRSKSSGKAGKLSDLISKVHATRALEPMVNKIKEMTQ